MKEELKKSYQEFKANCEKEMSSVTQEEVDQRIYHLYNYMDRFMSDMYSAIDRLYESQWKHEDGHLPKLTAGQTEKLFKMVGAENDYNVVKPTVYVSASRNKNSEITF